MTNYNVSLQNSNYNILSNPEQKYNIAVNYEIPSKYLQYGNEILDNISNYFDGVTNIFNLTLNSSPYTPVNDQQLVVSINGLIQSAGIDYTVSNNTIVFINSPEQTDKIYIVGLSTTADLTRTINFVHDAGSHDMSNGDKGELTIDVDGRIQSWTIFSEESGTLLLDIKKASFDQYPNLISICGTNKPNLFNQNKNRSINLNGWQTDIYSGDVIRFDVISSQFIRRFVVSLKIFL